MLMRIVLSILLSLFAVGCGPRYVDYFPYSDDGVLKPKVAIIPLIDRSPANHPRNISSELTREIRYEMMHNGVLYLLSSEEIKRGQALAGKIDFCTCNTALAKCFPCTDFIVITELLGQERVTSLRERAHPFYPFLVQLQCKIRIKIIDIRDNRCCTIHQEIVAIDGTIPCDSNRSVDVYPTTALENVYRSLVCKVVRRLEYLIRGAY